MRLRITRTQKTVLVLALLAALIMCLYPPWQFKVSNPVRWHSLGGVKGSSAWRPLWCGTQGTLRWNSLAYRIDWDRLLLQFVLLGLVTAIVFTYVGAMAFISSYETSIKTLAIFWPIWPAMIFIPIGFLMLTLRLSIQFKQDIASLLKPKG